VKTGLAEQKTKINWTLEPDWLAVGWITCVLYPVKGSWADGVAGERGSWPAAGLVGAARSDGSDRRARRSRQVHGSSMPVACGSVMAGAEL
jgi:hypothetical protein